MVFLILTSLLALYVAWNLGANDVANSMGTSVGSKAITLRQALAIAGVLEFTGAILFGHRVSATLATSMVDPVLFVAEPTTFVVGMVAALITCGIWLQIATALGLPIASSHAVVGAIAGFGCSAMGFRAVHWQTLGLVTLTWLATPLLSGAIAAFLYSQIKHWILDSSYPIQQLFEWIPWLSTALVSIFGVIVFPSIFNPEWLQALPLPSHVMPLGVGAIAAIGLTVFNWQQLQHDIKIQFQTLFQPPLIKPLGENQTELKIGHQNNSQQKDTNLEILCNEPPTETPEQHLVESRFARFQLLSACFVAFAHGSNDVGNAVAPLAAVAYVHTTGTVPTAALSVPPWILLLGGMGIVAGLAVMGKNVITTIGETIIPLKPSSGFCAELGTAATTLLASRLGLPVSTSHALVGAVVGIGLVQQLSQSNPVTIQLHTVRKIVLAWLITIPITAAGSALLFQGIQRIG